MHMNIGSYSMMQQSELSAPGETLVLLPFFKIFIQKSLDISLLFQRKTFNTLKYYHD